MRLERAPSTAWKNCKTVRGDEGRHHQDTIHAWSVFQDIISSLKNCAIQSQIYYEIFTFSQLDSNLKLFHSHIKHRKVSRPLVGLLKLLDDYFTDNPDVIAKCFVTSFHSVFFFSSASEPIYTSNIAMPNISVNDVESLLNELDPNSGMGGDGLHARFLKVLRSDLSVPLSIIFISSLQSCSLPTQWLSSIFIPLSKKPSRMTHLTTALSG